MSKDVYTTDEVARLLGKTPRTIHAWIKEKSLRSVQVKKAGRHMIPASEVERLLGREAA